MAIPLKDKDKLILMYEAGQIVARIFENLKEYVNEGKSTAELNSVVDTMIRQSGAKPAFLGYLNYPASTCISINEEIVHGIPSHNRFIKNGDIVSIDIGVFYRGIFGDAARTIAIGKVSRAAKHLIRTGKECAGGSYWIWLGLDSGSDPQGNGSIANSVTRYVGAGGNR